MQQCLPAPLAAPDQTEDRRDPGSEVGGGTESAADPDQNSPEAPERSAKATGPVTGVKYGRTGTAHYFIMALLNSSSPLQKSICIVVECTSKAACVMLQCQL